MFSGGVLFCSIIFSSVLFYHVVFWDISFFLILLIRIQMFFISILFVFVLFCSTVTFWIILFWLYSKLLFTSVQLYSYILLTFIPSCSFMLFWSIILLYFYSFTFSSVFPSSTLIVFILFLVCLYDLAYSILVLFYVTVMLLPIQLLSNSALQLPWSIIFCILYVTVMLLHIYFCSILFCFVKWHSAVKLGYSGLFNSILFIHIELWFILFSVCFCHILLYVYVLVYSVLSCWFYSILKFVVA